MQVDNIRVVILWQNPRMQNVLRSFCSSIQGHDKDESNVQKRMINYMEGRQNSSRLKISKANENTPQIFFLHSKFQA